MLRIDAIYFNGAGLLIPYYFGVVRALEEHGVDFAKVKLGGTSAGAIVAVMLALGLRYRDIKELGEEMTAWRRKGGFGFLLKNYLDKMMSLVKSRLLGDLDDLASSIRNLHIQVTAVDAGNVHSVIVTRFNSYEDLVSTLYGSCNIVPFFNGFRFMRDSYGRKLLDGGYINLADSVFEDCPSHITVSPLMKSTIYNKTFSRLQVIWPAEKSTPIINSGYRDACKYIRTGIPLGRSQGEDYWTHFFVYYFSFLVKFVCYILEFM
jgi:hypothetical protein